MKYLFSTLFLLSCTFFLGSSDLNADDTVNNESSTVVITRITKSGKPKGYLTSDAKIRLNDGPQLKFRRKPTMTFGVPVGMNTIYVNQNLTVGKSSITFDAKAGETYTFNIYWREDVYWLRIYGGYIGQAIENSISGETVGGTFGIRMTDTTYNPSQAISNSTSIEQTKIPTKNEIQDEVSIESELLKLKILYEKGLISSETYEKRQLELLQD
ncbi:MAG: hypothetical protein P8M55_05455 [Gammaproteobacteria bacterium]|nr:hypothetical protein [Gammaproteobacteria bacterium]